MDLVTDKEARQIEENFRNKLKENKIIQEIDGVESIVVDGNGKESRMWFKQTGDILNYGVKIKEMVNHPEHYSQGKYEPIDVINDWKLDFNLRKCNQICGKSWKKR